MYFEMFLILTYGIGALVIWETWSAFQRSRDTFHPMIFMGPMMGYLYCFMPLRMFVADRDGLTFYLSASNLEFTQLLHLLGVLCFCVGMRQAEQGARFNPNDAQVPWVLAPEVCQRLEQALIVVGSLGVLAFAYTVVQVGGFASAFGTGYSGGWASSGYIRDAVMLTLPALTWILTTHAQRKMSTMDWFWVLLFAAPHLIYGTLGGRRGPLFLIVVALAVGWFLVRFRRPPLIAVLSSGAVLGVLLLLLITNRANIYIGSDFELDSNLDHAFKASSGNEFIYAAGTMINAEESQRFLWGRRFIAVVFLRPIPRSIWPNKYVDISQMLGIGNLEQNLGLGTYELKDTLGWAGNKGAANGMVADMWVEFYWFAFPVIAWFGWLYGMVWRKAIVQGKQWIPVYVLMASFSIYLIMQGLEPILVRLLESLLGHWAIWKYGNALPAPSAIREQRSPIPSKK